MADISRILREYNMIDHINNIIESGIIMSKGEWKQIVNNKVMDKENKEWKATRLLCRGLTDIKSTCIHLKTRCPWWVVAKWDYSLLCTVKVMWKLLVSNNIKNRYNYDCV